MTAINFKRVKVKLQDQAGKELVGHYFNPKDLQSEDGSKAIMQIPQMYLQSMRQ